MKLVLRSVLLGCIALLMVSISSFAHAQAMQALIMVSDLKKAVEKNDIEIKKRVDDLEKMLSESEASRRSFASQLEPTQKNMTILQAAIASQQATIAAQQAVIEELRKRIKGLR